MDLPASVWVAVVGALASVTAAICAVVASMRSVRVKAEADMVLERFRAEDARRRHAFEVATREAEPVATALVQVWNDIQSVRDVIRKAIAPMAYDEELATTALRAAVASIASAYGRYGSLLPPAAEHAWHDAKNTADLVETLIQKRGTGAQPNPAAADVDERLLALRSQLRDAQAVLQHSTLDLRAQSMDRILARL